MPKHWPWAVSPNVTLSFTGKSSFEILAITCLATVQYLDITFVMLRCMVDTAVLQSNSLDGITSGDVFGE